MPTADSASVVQRRLGQSNRTPARANWIGMAGLTFVFALMRWVRPTYALPARSSRFRADDSRDQMMSSAFRDPDRALCELLKCGPESCSLRRSRPKRDP